LLEISRIDAGSAKLDPVMGEFEMIVRNVLEDLSPIIRDNGVVVEEIQIPASPAMLTADFRRLERIVRNLISNAIEHANGNPITLVTYHDEKVVVFSVRDHGSGLEPGQAALVFNRFWRADPSRQRTLGGTGLGLSISMEDARLHGGWLEADGAPNEGAHFRLVLPLQPNTGFDRVVVPLGIKKFDQWLKAQS
jgi:two-component system sensor histidine kinase MtrB